MAQMADEKAIAETRNYIKAQLQQLALELKKGRASCSLVSVIPHALMCAHRPLRYHPKFGGSGLPLPPEAAPEVISWVDRIQDDGIRSIICLMHPKEIQHYAKLDIGAPDIISLYRQRGLIVCH